MTTPSNHPLVSIGVPVYNGEAYLEDALKALVSQDYPAIEILVSDNASTDRTEEICRRMVQHHPQICYTRNAENWGPMANFLQVLQMAAGQYFMWAAHDDLWDAPFVSALVEALVARPEAVLATPKTIRVQLDGSPSDHADDRPAPGRSRLGNLRVFYADLASCWIYGLFRTDWLRDHSQEWGAYPTWGGDVMWLASVVLRYPVVGTPDAVIRKRVNRDSYETYAPKSETQKIQYAMEMLRQLTDICSQYSETWLLRVASTLLAWRFVYGRYIRRGNPLKTLRRLARLPAIIFHQWRDPRPPYPAAVAQPAGQPHCRQATTEHGRQPRAGAA